MQTATQKIAQVHMRRHPEEAARVLEGFSPGEIVAALQAAPVESVAGVLACFAPALASSCLDPLARGRAFAGRGAACQRQLPPRCYATWNQRSGKMCSGGFRPPSVRRSIKPCGIRTSRPGRSPTRRSSRSTPTSR